MTSYAFVLDSNISLEMVKRIEDMQQLYIQNKMLLIFKAQRNIVRKLMQGNVKYFGNILRFTG